MSTSSKPSDLFSVSLCLPVDLHQIRGAIEQDLIQKAEKKYASLGKAVISRKCIRETIQKAYQVFERKARAAYSEYPKPEHTEGCGYEILYKVLLKDHKRYFETDLLSKIEAVFKPSSQKPEPL